MSIYDVRNQFGLTRVIVVEVLYILRTPQQGTFNKFPENVTTVTNVYKIKSSHTDLLIQRTEKIQNICNEDTIPWDLLESA